MQPTNFTDFNPLDVLAAAASLQSARIGEAGDQNACHDGDDASVADEEAVDKDGDDECEESDIITQNNVVVCNGVEKEEVVEAVPQVAPPATVQTINGRRLLPATVEEDNGGKPVVTLTDATKFVLPPGVPAGKGLTVLRIKQQSSDHSYAYVCQLNLKHEEDEGYSSRSSVDEEVEDHNSRLLPQTPIDTLSEVNSPLESDKGSPGMLSPISPSPELPNRQAKILIVNNSQQILTSTSDPKLLVNTPPGKVGSNIVLRTLLGQKPLVTAPQKVQPTISVRSVNASKHTNNIKATLALPLPGSNPTILKCPDVQKTTHEFVSPMSPPITIPKQQTHIVKIVSNNQHIANRPSSLVQVAKNVKNNAPAQNSTAENEGISTGMLLNTVNTMVTFESDISQKELGTGSTQKSDCDLPQESKDVVDASKEKETNVVLETLETKCVSDQKDNTDGKVNMNTNVENVPPLDEPGSAIVTAKSPNEDCDNNDSLGTERCVQLESDCHVDHQTISVEEESIDETKHITHDNTSLENEIDDDNGPGEAVETSQDADEVSTPDNSVKHDLSNEVLETVNEGNGQQDKQNEEAAGPSIETEESSVGAHCVPQSIENTTSKSLTTESVTSTVSSTAHSAKTMDVDIDNNALASEVDGDAVAAVNNQYIIEDDVPPVTKFRTVTPKQIAVSDIDVPLDPVLTKVSNSLPKEAVVTLTSSDPKTVVTSMGKSVIPASKQSLLKGPVVTKPRPGGNIVHVIPMVNGRRGGIVAQVLPKTLQYVTAVPVSNKGVMRVLDPNMPLGTVLVPATIAPVSGAAPRPTHVQLLPSIAKPLSTVASPTLSSSVATTPDSSLDHSNTASPATDTMDSPIITSENVLGDVLGRRTPTSLILGRSTPDGGLSSLDTSPVEKNKLKISSSPILENCDSVENSDINKESRSIGTVGSLSWKNLGANNPGLIQLGGKGNQREFIRIQGSQIQTGMALSECESFKPASDVSERSRSPWLRPDDSASVASATDDARSSRDSDESSCLDPSEPPSEDSSPPIPVVVRRRKKGEPKNSRSSTPVWLNSELHPLIDHDYCMFTEFNAQIQSSIIATTESKVKTERKYNKKTKAARTKSVIPPPVYRGRVDKLAIKGKKGRMRKKDILRLAELKEIEVSESLDMDDDGIKEEHPEKDSKKLKSERKVSERRRALDAKEKKNYVKITGSYQDEFVYFATRVKRGRPRKPVENPADAQAAVAKLPSVGGVNVFDWYRDMSKTDKSSYFGSPDVTDASSPPSPNMDKCNTGYTSTSSAKLPEISSSKSSNTPIHESEVVDLVCELSDMMPSSTPTMGDELQNLITSQEEEEGEKLETETIPADIMDLNQMAEQVRNMLNSMGEAELQMLENLEHNNDSANQEKASSANGLADNSFDGFLANFTSEAEPTLTQGTTSTNLSDLDEINDHDLLDTDIGNMNAILGELKSANGAATQTSKPIPSASMGTLSEIKLDKTELFPDIHSPTINIPLNNDVTAPELTVVSMYWNDLPGLLISGKQYVRLVDIHKQVLPAKDTGILKKRCQMMGLQISNCTELQRDFLIRYANAAKSKSTVIISKDAAKTLIGFYVHPKPRVRHNTGGEKPVAGDVEKVAEGG